MSCPRWCISCSFGASSISKRLFDASGAPGGIVTRSARNPSPTLSTNDANLSPSALRNAIVSAFVRGFASSAMTFCIISWKLTSFRSVILLLWM